jgi:hypothetical protein
MPKYQNIRRPGFFVGICPLFAGNPRREKGDQMKLQLQKGIAGSMVAVIGMAGVAFADNVSVGVDVNTPNVRVRATNAPPPPPPQVTVVERERVIVREKDSHHDNGKHKGHNKKHKKKHKEHKHDD